MSVIIYSEIESLDKFILYQKYNFLPKIIYIYFFQNLQNGSNPSCRIISSTIYISVDTKRVMLCFDNCKLQLNFLPEVLLIFVKYVVGIFSSLQLKKKFLLLY